MDINDQFKRKKPKKIDEIGETKKGFDKQKMTTNDLSKYKLKKKVNNKRGHMEDIAREILKYSKKIKDEENLLKTQNSEENSLNVAHSSKQSVSSETESAFSLSHHESTFYTQNHIVKVDDYDFEFKVSIHGLQLRTILDIKTCSISKEDAIILLKLLGYEMDYVLNFEKFERNNDDDVQKEVTVNQSTDLSTVNGDAERKMDITLEQECKTHVLKDEQNNDIFVKVYNETDKETSESIQKLDALVSNVDKEISVAREVNPTLHRMPILTETCLEDVLNDTEITSQLMSSQKDNEIVEENSYKPRTELCNDNNVERKPDKHGSVGISKYQSLNSDIEIDYSDFCYDNDDFDGSIPTGLPQTSGHSYIREDIDYDRFTAFVCKDEPLDFAEGTHKPYLTEKNTTDFVYGVKSDRYSEDSSESYAPMYYPKFPNAVNKLESRQDESKQVTLNHHCKTSPNRMYKCKRCHFKTVDFSLMQVHLESGAHHSVPKLHLQQREDKFTYPPKMTEYQTMPQHYEYIEDQQLPKQREQHELYHHNQKHKSQHRYEQHLQPQQIAQQILQQKVQQRQNHHKQQQFQQQTMQHYQQHIAPPKQSKPYEPPTQKQPMYQQESSSYNQVSNLPQRFQKQTQYPHIQKSSQQPKQFQQLYHPQQQQQRTAQQRQDYYEESSQIQQLQHISQSATQQLHPTPQNFQQQQLKQSYQLSNKIEKTYKCKKCNYSSTHTMVKKHIITTHLKEKIYQCKTCGYCSSHDIMTQHMNMHKTQTRMLKPQTRYECSVCGWEFETVNDLTSHISLNHRQNYTDSSYAYSY